MTNLANHIHLGIDIHTNNLEKGMTMTFSLSEFINEYLNHTHFINTLELDKNQNHNVEHVSMCYKQRN